MLQSVGEGQPPIPKSHLEIPKPPLTLQTGRGTYYVELLWQPEVIGIGNLVLNLDFYLWIAHRR